MTIDDGDAIFNSIGDLSDREGCPPFGDDHFPGRVEYAGFDLSFLSYFAIADPHFLSMLHFLTLLANVNPFLDLPNYFTVKSCRCCQGCRECRPGGHAGVGQLMR